MKLTIYSTPTGYNYDPWNTLWWHDNARVIDVCSRGYREIDNIRSDTPEVREEARRLIFKLLEE